MTCRKTKTIVYRIFALVALIAVAALSWIAFSFVFDVKAYAEQSQSEHDKIFGADHASATALSSAFKELPSGSYYLTDDIVLIYAVEMFRQENVKLCLHGHSISISSKHVFEIYGTSKLSIYDCGGADSCGSISGGKGVYITNGGTLNMYGGEIREGDGLNSAVSVSGKGVFNMYDGAITDNASSNGSGGVHVGSSGTFNMYGGTISNNTTTAHYGGAGVLVSDSTAVFHMYGGSITNNVLSTENVSSEDSLSLFYKGAGVYVNGGEFSIAGDVNISGNVRGNGNSNTLNNVELLNNDHYDCKIDIKGKLGDNTRIGVTAPIGVFTKGYSLAGNTKDPSEYFTSDNGFSISFDAMRKEGAVTNGAIGSGYNMVDARVIGSPSATVGDTEVTFTVEATLENTDGASADTIIDVVKVELESPLHGGNNPVSFDYKYNGASGEQTKQLSYIVVPKKLHVNVVWTCSGATEDGRNSAKRNYDGNDIFGSIAASYTGYDGEKNRIIGSWESGDIIVVDDDGNSVTTTASVGVYKFYLAPSVDYEFDNNLFTVTVVGTVDDGYYQMQDAAAKGMMGSPTVGDKSITVIVERKLVHTKDQSNKTDRVNYSVTLITPLHVGENTVEFDYKYVDMGGGMQNKHLSVTVTAVKKNVTIAWYFYDSLAVGNAAKRVYDGSDASEKIVAVFDGIDGNKQRVDGSSDFMLKIGESGNAVNSLSEVGVYTLLIADSDDYEFENNLFTYTVVEDLCDITDLVYKESGKTILGVSCDGGFESGTELAVERIDCDSSVVDGEINAAFDVKFVKDSAEITHTGVVTVHVLIPDELRNGAKYKVYNLANGIAIEVTYSTDGNYAIFNTDDLTCILFVTERNAPPIDDPNHNVDNPNSNDKPNGSGLTWLWILLPILAVGGAGSGVLVFMLKRKKKSDKTSGGTESAQQVKPEHEHAEEESKNDLQN